MLAVEDNSSSVSSVAMAAAALNALLALHPTSINAKVLSICLHVLSSNNCACMEVVTYDLPGIMHRKLGKLGCVASANLCTPTGIDLIKGATLAWSPFK